MATVPTSNARDGSKDIVPMLLDLQSRGTLISVSVSGVPDTYLSIVLKADIRSGRLLFDGLRSHHSNLTVKAGSMVTVRARLGMDNVAFDCIVDTPFQMNKTATFSAHFPRSLQVVEQRNAYRVRIPAAMSTSAVQLDMGDNRYEGRLLDISRKGAGTLLPIRINPGMEPRVRCSFRLLDSRFETRADIRSASELNTQHRLGLLFADLPTAEHRRLDSTIAALERIILRDHARLMVR